MKNILFDTSIHLGQFMMNDERLRKGSKNMQASLPLKEEYAAVLGQVMDSVNGTWSDLENGRTDKTMWSLPSKLQDAYYPVMDRFYSITDVPQAQFNEREEEVAYEMRKRFPRLHPYSRHSCATAIVRGMNEIHTYVRELLGSNVRSFLSDHGITVVQPEADVEIPYKDPVLEERYQTARAAFRAFDVNVFGHIIDQREIGIDRRGC